MALQKIIDHNIRLVGLTQFNSYIRVGIISGTKELLSVEAHFLTDNCSGDLIRVESFEFVPDLSGPNFIQQAYNYLKTLPEFSDAVDC